MVILCNCGLLLNLKEPGTPLAALRVHLLCLQFSFKMAQTSAPSSKLAGQKVFQGSFCQTWWCFNVFFMFEVISAIPAYKIGTDQLITDNVCSPHRCDV